MKKKKFFFFQVDCLITGGATSSRCLFIESDVPGNEAQPTHLNFFFFRSETQIDGKASVRERNKFQQRKGHSRYIDCVGPIDAPTRRSD